MTDLVLGVDIGGTGMKAAMVDPTDGVKVTRRHRIPTPRPAEPRAMAEVFEALADRFEARGPVGCTFPGVVLGRSTIATAVNLDPSWHGVDAARLFGDRVEGTVTMVNDADAAGIAEMRVGAGRDVDGVVVMITIGTGLGTAVFHDGVLLPNTELGHLEIDGEDAEVAAAGRVLDTGVSLDEWAPRFGRYLQTVEALLWPDMFILGGGVGKRFDQFAPLLDTRASLRPAELRNHAGIVGAAMYAAESR